jgi:hypothetical protein
MISRDMTVPPAELSLNSILPLPLFRFAVIKVKVKAIPLQALTGPEGSRRLRLPDLMTIGT